MPTNHSSRVLLVALTAVVLAIAGLSQPASAQDDGTTSTTQLDLGGGEAPADSTTSTTQLDIGGEAPADPTATTQLSVGGQQAPTRVDAGAGGTANDPSIPLPGVALAGGLIVVLGAAALKVRREVQA